MPDRMFTLADLPRARASAEQKPPRAGRLQAVILVGSVVLVALIWLGIGRHIQQSYETGREQVRRDVTNLSTALAEQVSRLIDGTDQIMRLIQGDHAADPARFDFAAWMRRVTWLKDVAVQITLFDANGDLVAARDPGPPGRRPNVSDRTYFHHLAAHPEAGLYIDRTVQGRLRPNWSFQLARRLQRSDGGFGGVLVVSLDPEFIAGEFRDLDVGQAGSVTLMGLDGYVRARNPALPGMYDYDGTQTDGGVIEQLKRTSAGTYEAPSTLDGRRRVFGFRRLDHLPLIVKVAKAEDEALAHLLIVQHRSTAVGLAVTALIAAFAAFLVRELARRKRQDLLLTEARDAAAREAGRFRFLAENTADMIIQVGLDGTCLYVSPACRDMIGYEPDELTGETNFDKIHPDDRAAAQATLGSLFEGAQDRAIIRQRLGHKAGHFIWVEVSAKLLRDAGGRPMGAIASLRSVARQVAAEEELRDSERRYRLLAENTKDMIVRVDMDATRRWVSPACRDLLGYEPHELVGTKPLDDVHPDDLPEVRAVISDLREGRRNSAVKRQRYRRKDGSYVWVEVSYRLIFAADGQAIGCVACTRDVSEQQAQALALQAMTGAAERARADAEQASQAKTEFLAAMSHEIRTPLNAVIGFTDLLAGSRRLDPELQRYAELAASAGNALLTVVNDILDFSRIEAGAVALQPKAFAPRVLAADCVAIVEGIARAKDLTVTVEADERVPQGLVGDPDRLRQILLNLLNNAIKFTQRGSVCLAVRCVTSSTAGVHLRFSVADTGIGIPRAKQHRLFQRFSQADETILREFGGTGLGLAICKRLVDLMGGAIGVISEEGRGAEFWFEMVLPIGALPAPAALVSSEPPAPRRGRILVAEDVEFNQVLARALLEGAGHSVDIVTDGLAAVRAIEEEGSYDLVLMDVQMPRMDGLTATQLVRGLGGRAARLPIIAMTANVLPDQIRRCREAGMDGHVGKPLNRAELHTAIDRSLRERGERLPSRADPFDIGAFNQGKVDQFVAMIGPELTRQLVQKLLHQLASALGGSAATQDDRDRMRHEAHQLAGATGTLGFEALSTICMQLELHDENMVEHDGADTFQILLTQIRKQIAMAMQHCKQLVQDMGDNNKIQIGTMVS